MNYTTPIKLNLVIFKFKLFLKVSGQKSKVGYYVLFLKDNEYIYFLVSFSCIVSCLIDISYIFIYCIIPLVLKFQEN